MAHTKIWPIKHDLMAAIEYVMNKDKTQNGDCCLCSGIALNVSSPNSVMYQMMDTKERWRKKGGRLAYHAVQSFKPGEVTPELAHEIGLRFAKEVWGDRFEVLVATHLDKDHIHNHFIINSVSDVDGYKYHQPTKAYYEVIRGISDRLCREYGLSVIEPKENTRYKSRPEVKPEQGKPPTVHTLIYQDIDNAIQMSVNLDGFYNVLRQMGYEVKRFGANGAPLAHPAIKPPPKSDGREHHFFRLDKFVKGYTENDIKQRLSDRANGKEDMGKFINLTSSQAADAPPIHTKKANYWRHICGPTPVKDRRYMYSGVVLSYRTIQYRSFKYRSYFNRRVNWYGLRKAFTKLCFVLKSVQRTSYPNYPSHELRREVQKLHQYSEETMLLHKHKIDTLPQLLERQKKVEDGIYNVNLNRKRLRREIKAAAPEEAEQLKAELEHFQQLAKDLYHERALLNDIAERSQSVERTVEREQERAVGYQYDRQQQPPTQTKKPISSRDIER